VSLGLNCIYNVPSITQGVYINGYTVVVKASVDGKTAKFESMNLTLSYQEQPLQYWDDFTQTVILQDSSHAVSTQTYVIIFVCIIIVLVIGVIVLTRYYRSLPDRRYTRIATEMEGDEKYWQPSQSSKSLEASEPSEPSELSKSSKSSKSSGPSKFSELSKSLEASEPSELLKSSELSKSSKSSDPLKSSETLKSSEISESSKPEDTESQDPTV